MLEQIEEVSIDLWLAYKSLVEELMPYAQIVADRFHVMAQVNDELDAQRKQQKRDAERGKAEAKNAEKKLELEKILEAIKKSKYVLLKNEVALNEQNKNKLESVKLVCPILGQMHELKEEFRKIFDEECDWLAGLFKLGSWLSCGKDYFLSSRKTIIRWLYEIIAYFDNRTTSGVVEGNTNKLKLIKRSAYGFRNFDNF